jgi:hypothetical protein
MEGGKGGKEGKRREEEKRWKDCRMIGRMVGRKER